MYAQHHGLHAWLQVFPFPGKDETYQVPFTRVVYIEQDDFREQDQKKYFGLAPGKSVLLRCHTSHTLLLAHLHVPYLLNAIMTNTQESFNLLLLGLSAQLPSQHLQWLILVVPMLVMFCTQNSDTSVWLLYDAGMRMSSPVQTSARRATE